MIKEARIDMAQAIKLRDLKAVQAVTSFRRQMGDNEFIQLDDDAVKLQAELDAMPTALYRHYDSGNKLLYVGISLKAISRTMQHRARSLWYTQITRIEMTWFGSRTTAEAAERLAIKAERPLYNITHSKKARAHASTSQPQAGEVLPAGEAGHPALPRIPDGGVQARRWRAISTFR